MTNPYPTIEEVRSNGVSPIGLSCARCKSKRVHVREHKEFSTVGGGLKTHKKRTVECCACGLSRPHGSPEFSGWRNECQTTN